MFRLLEIFAWLAVMLYFFNRSPFGNRNKEQQWPAWMDSLGDRDIPHIVSADWFFWPAWISRRILPIVFSVTIFSLQDYLSASGTKQWLLSGPDWLAILTLTSACFIAYIPFAKKPRRHPVDKWMGVALGLGFVLLGIILSLTAIAFHYIRISNHSMFWHVAGWTATFKLSDSLGFTGGITAFGIAVLGMVELLPNWRTGLSAVDNSAELEDLRLRNQRLETEVKKLRRKLRSYDHPNHQ